MRAAKFATSFALGAAMVVVAAVSGCTSAKRGEAQPPEARAASTLAEADYPGQLVPSDRVGRSFLARQVLRVQWEGRRREFEVAVQLYEGTLKVVGLAPWGGKAFVLEQRGTQVNYDSHLPEGVELPFPPRFILQDVSRAFLYDALLPWGNAASPGTHAHTVGDERVVEVWVEGGLQTRRFTRLDGHPAGTISVVYGEGMRDGRPPDRVTLSNEWFGYVIEVQTVQYQPL